MPKEIQITSSFSEYASIHDLNVDDKSLLEKAVAAALKAYAPYSGFRVGAAVLMENGEIVVGNNQENAAYPSGLCAERVAVFQASARFPGVRIVAIAVTAEKIKGPVSPCGACRQSICEYEALYGPIRLIMGADHGTVYISNSIVNLLPLAFTKQSL